MKIKEKLLTKLFTKKSTFKYCLNYTNKHYRPYDPGKFLYNYLCDYSGKFLSEKHIELIYTTLIAWDMNSRGAKLHNYKTFRNSLLKEKITLRKLHLNDIDKMSNKDFIKVFSEIKILYGSLKISATKTKLIGFSKTLHLLMPKLIAPIDRKYSLRFFYNSKNINYKTQYDDFCDIQKILHCISLRYKIRDHLNNGWSWNKNVPKIFDNAIIGFVSAKL